MGKALDTYQNSKVIANADKLKAEGFTAIGLYFFHSSAFKELLTRTVAKALSAAGFYLFSLWEDGRPTSVGYFNAAKGIIDGVRAAQCAVNAGQPKGTPVYAAYDYDASRSDLTVLTAYAKNFQAALAKSGYTAGAYGNGLLLRHLKEAGIVSHTFLSESKGFAGYADWKPHADIVQSIGGNIHGIDYDADLTNGAAGGWKVTE